MEATRDIEIQIFKKPGLEDLPLPTYPTESSSGVDLYAAIDGERRVNPGDIALIPTGIRIAIPNGFEAQVRPRGELAVEGGLMIVNSPGTIDSDYRGEIGVILCNMGEEEFVIKRGMKIAQLVFQTVVRARFQEVPKLDEAAQGEPQPEAAGSGTAGQ